MRRRFCAWDNTCVQSCKCERRRKHKKFIELLPCTGNPSFWFYEDLKIVCGINQLVRHGFAIIHYFMLYYLTQNLSLLSVSIVGWFLFFSYLCCFPFGWFMNCFHFDVEKISFELCYISGKHVLAHFVVKHTSWTIQPLCDCLHPKTLSMLNMASNVITTNISTPDYNQRSPNNEQTINADRQQKEMPTRNDEFLLRAQYAHSTRTCAKRKYYSPTRITQSNSVCLLFGVLFESYFWFVIAHITVSSLFVKKMCMHINNRVKFINYAQKIKTPKHTI